MSMKSTGLQWRKSSRCDTASCVEVAVTGTGIAMRDSKAPHQSHLELSRQDWKAFVAGLKLGEFDRK
jgi:hypothetical protein